MKLAILASGEGRTFQNVFDHQLQMKPNWQLTAVITDNPKAGIIARTANARLPLQIVSPKDFRNRSAWDEALASAIETTGADAVFLLGFLRQLGPAALKASRGQIFNVHPSLLPRHGGKGMYGRRVHEAVIASGDKQSGASIHRVNANYDEGHVLRCEVLNVQPGETPASLEERVRAVEGRLIVRFLDELAAP